MVGVFHYEIYGLRLDADTELRGVTVAPGLMPPDVRVELAGLGTDTLSKATEWLVQTDEDDDDQEAVRSWTLEREGRAYLRIRYAIDDQWAEFFIDGAGTWVGARSSPGVVPEDVASFLLGPVLGRVLRLRSVPCLHGSVVAVNGRALAIAGSKGAGKSTTAAGLAVSGCAVLSDDIVALVRSGDEHTVQPGYRKLRLWNPAIEAFYGSREKLPRVVSNRNKRYLDLEAGESALSWRFHADPLPLGAVYVLGPRLSTPAAPCIRSLTRAQALLALTAHRYATHMQNPASRAHEFEFLAQLVRAVPVRQVERRDDMDDIRRVCAAILEDFERLGAVAPVG